MTIEGARLKIRNLYIKHTAKRRNRKIKYKDFSIISNNCWGGVVYESYALQKVSPTVGMYFAPEEYLKFVRNLRHYICEETISFVRPDEARHKNLYVQDNTFGQYPIARVGDVEIAFLHYRSEIEAREKWERRCARVHWDRLIVKMNDQNGCTYEDMDSFMNEEIPCAQKLFFTVHKEWAKKNKAIIYIPQFTKDHIFASKEPFGKSRRCDMNKIINTL